MSNELINAAEAPILAYNKKDWSAVAAAVTPNFKYDEVATHQQIEGVEDVIEAWKGWATAFPDSTATLHRSHVAEDKVIIELTWKGTHTGPMQTPNGQVPATGKTLNMRGCVISTVVGGKVASQTHYFDMATMFSQLGLNG